MAPPAATALSARPHLTLVPPDAAVAELDQRLDLVRGEMITYKPASPGGKWLIKFVDCQGIESAVFAIDEDRFTPHVKALLWEVAEAVEAEGLKKR